MNEQPAFSSPHSPVVTFLGPITKVGGENPDERSFLLLQGTSLIELTYPTPREAQLARSALLDLPHTHKVPSQPLMEAIAQAVGQGPIPDDPDDDADDDLPPLNGGRRTSDAGEELIDFTGEDLTSPETPETPAQLQDTGEDTDQDPLDPPGTELRR